MHMYRKFTGLLNGAQLVLLPYLVYVKITVVIAIIRVITVLLFYYTENKFEKKLKKKKKIKL